MSSSPPSGDEESPASWREQELMGGTSGGAAASPPAEVVSSDLVVAPPVEEVVGALPLGNWPPDYALWVIDTVHTTLDVPWFVAISLTTIAIRTALLPISFATMRATSNMQRAKPEIAVLQARMKADTQQDSARAAMYQRQMQALMEKHDVKLSRIFAFPFAQLPVFTSMFFGLQRLGDHFPDAMEGGALWFSDLTVRDPYYVLPVATSALFLAMVEVGADGAAAGTGQGRMFKFGMRGMAIALIPFTGHMPASVFCYWLTANAYSLIQTGLLNKVPGTRKILGLPPLPKVKNVGDNKTIVEDVTDAFKRAKKAWDENNKKENPPVVAEDIFDRKKQGNAFLSSRPHESVKIFAQKPQKAKEGSSRKNKK